MTILSILFYSFWCLVLSKGWPWQRSLHFFISIDSLLACSISPTLSATLSCMDSFTLSFHLLELSVSLIYFLHKLFTILSFYMIKPPQRISFHPLHYTIFHIICTSSQATSFIHTLILPFCPSTCSSKITHFHTMHSWLICFLQHAKNMETYMFQNSL